MTRTALLVLALVAPLTACSDRATEQPQAQSAKAEPAAPAPAEPAEPAMRVDAERAMRYVREVVAIGRRALGSPGHAKVQQYIKAHLKGVDIVEDDFTAKTPVGDFAGKNIIAKFPGTKDGIVVIAGHYDTNYPLKDYVGANDSGSSTALLLEFANQIKAKKREGYSIWLVWMDAEEAFVRWSAEDSLYGSRHLAEKLQQDGTAPKIKAFLLVDMIGDADLHVERDLNSTPWLIELVRTAATRLGYQSYFFRREVAVEDDHLPFRAIGVPVIDLIDLHYGYNNVFHHTQQDTLDKVSARSLELVGDVVLETVRLLDAR